MIPDALIFSPCRYCGGKIPARGGYTRAGNFLPGNRDGDPDYCSEACWSECHEFDRKIATSRNCMAGGKPRVETFDDEVHSESGPQAPIPGTLIDPPDQEVAAKIERRAKDAQEVLRMSAFVDPRLPSILTLISNGVRQVEIARKLKVSEPTISVLLKKLRDATHTPASDSEESDDIS